MGVAKKKAGKRENETQIGVPERRARAAPPVPARTRRPRGSCRAPARLRRCSRTSTLGLFSQKKQTNKQTKDDQTSSNPSSTGQTKPPTAGGEADGVHAAGVDVDDVLDLADGFGALALEDVLAEAQLADVALTHRQRQRRTGPRRHRQRHLNCNKQTNQIN